MAGYFINIEEKTLNNTYFRDVLFTASHMQLVVMSLKLNEEIGLEVHTVDQFFRIESGEGKIVLDGEEYQVKNGDVVIVPAGVNHNVINTSSTDNLKLYTIYAPPQHPDKTQHQTKEEALKEEVHE